MHPDRHRDGIGGQLTQYRIDRLLLNKQVDAVEVRTSQFTFEFYQKMGFKLDKIEKDYWAKGFDLYHMTFDKVT